MKKDQLVLGFSVIVITALAIMVFVPPCIAKRTGETKRITGPEMSPRKGESVIYGEFSNDGTLWRGRMYIFDGNIWNNTSTCYPSTGKGCKPGWNEITYKAAASIAGQQYVELNSDIYGFLRRIHPKSKFEYAPALWQKIKNTMA